MSGEEVIFDVDEFALLVDPETVSRILELESVCSPFKGVAAITMIVNPAVGCSMVAEEHQSGMVPASC